MIALSASSKSMPVVSTLVSSSSGGGGKTGSIAKPVLGLPSPSASCATPAQQRDRDVLGLVPVGVEDHPPLLQVDAEVVLELVEAVAGDG